MQDKELGDGLLPAAHNDAGKLDMCTTINMHTCYEVRMVCMGADEGAQVAHRRLLDGRGALLELRQDAGHGACGRGGERGAGSCQRWDRDL